MACPVTLSRRPSGFASCGSRRGAGWTQSAITRGKGSKHRLLASFLLQTRRESETGASCHASTTSGALLESTNNTSDRYKHNGCSRPCPRGTPDRDFTATTIWKSAPFSLREVVTNRSLIGMLSECILRVCILPAELRVAGDKGRGVLSC